MQLRVLHLTALDFLIKPDMGLAANVCILPHSSFDIDQNMPKTHLTIGRQK